MFCFPRHLKFLKKAFIRSILLLSLLNPLPSGFHPQPSTNSSHEGHRWPPCCHTQWLVLCLYPSCSIWHIDYSSLSWNSSFAFHESVFLGFLLLITAFHCLQSPLLISPCLPHLQFWGIPIFRSQTSSPSPFIPQEISLVSGLNTIHRPRPLSELQIPNPSAHLTSLLPYLINNSSLINWKSLISLTSSYPTSLSIGFPISINILLSQNSQSRP